MAVQYNPDHFSPLALRAMKVCACLLTITGSQVRGTGSLLKMCIKKSPGVTADNSHFSFDTTNCSHLCNNQKRTGRVQTIAIIHLVTLAGFSYWECISRGWTQVDRQVCQQWIETDKAMILCCIKDYINHIVICDS